MSLTGGPSDKLGNRFEDWWTASVMLDLLRQDRGVICIEALGPDGERIEFWVERDGRREVHQVKRQHHFHGHWTLAELQKRGVIDAFRNHLSDGTTHALFVSTHSVEGLVELSERARQAPNDTEFRAYFLGAKDAKKAYTTFEEYWGGTQPEQFTALCHIHVESISEEAIRTLVGAQAALWFDESAAAIVGVLHELAVSRMHNEMRPFDLWSGLEKLGIRRRPSTNIDTLALSAKEQTRRYLNAGQDIAGKRLIRAEVAALAEALRNGQVLTWIVGAAGSGKSEVARDLVRTLESYWPTLALRLDGLEPISTAKGLGETLGLPLNPAHALGTVAQGKDALLLVDQLDALSMASGRRGRLLDAIQETVETARHYPKMRVVVVCRQFDLDNDFQLRQFKNKVCDGSLASIGPLSTQEVQDTVREVGGDAAVLTDKQVEILSLPLHLSMYADVVSTGEAFSGFRTPTQIFEKYCSIKHRAALDRSGIDEWLNVTNTLVERMNRDELLKAPWGVLSAWQPFAEALVSEHVLVRTEQSIHFFHESLFDYLFARSFDSAKRLLDWLHGTEQGLFRRAQIRQVLAFRRDDDHSRYIADLRELLLHPEVRFHLKYLLLGLLGQVSTPNWDEAAVMEKFIRDADFRAGRHALFATAAKAEWFAPLTNVVRDLIQSETEAIRLTGFWWLARISDRFADEVADVVAPLIDRGGEWPDRVAGFVTNCRGYNTGDRFVDMVVQLVESGALDRWSNWNWLADPNHIDIMNWSNILRVVEALLQRRLTLWVQRGDDLRIYGFGADRVIAGLATADAGSLVERLLPLFLRAVGGEPEGGGEQSYPYDKFTLSRRDRPRDNLWTNVIEALTSGVAELLRVGDQRGADALHQLSKFERLTPQRVVAQALARAAATVADEAVGWLLSDSRRLELRLPVLQEDYSYELIATAACACGQSSFDALETVLLRYRPANERNAKYTGAQGRSQWRLLSALPENRLSDTARRRLGELTRQFRPHSPMPAWNLQPVLVTSPIEQEATQRMSDDDWLRAIAKYTMEFDLRWEEDGPRGGASELARELQSRAAEEPARFAALAHRMATSAPPTYLRAVLSGVRNGGLGLDLLEPLLVLAHEIPERPHGREISDVMGTNPTLPWSEASLDLLCWYALNDPSPRPNSDDFGGLPLVERVHTVGINSVRGRVAECLGMLIQVDGERLPRLRPAIEALAVDPSDAVRCCAGVAVTGVLCHDTGSAVELTVALLRHGGLARATPPVETLLYYLLPAHTERLLGFLVAMLEDTVEEVVAAATRRICLTALSDERAVSFAEQCLSGTDICRSAAATIFAANIYNAADRQFCERALRAFFQDPSPDVRRAAASCFRQDEVPDLSGYLDLGHCFVQSPAFADDPDGVILAIERSNGNCSALTAALSHRFLDLFGDEAGNIQTHASVTAHSLSPLLVRAYAQSAQQPETRRSCLDAIDRMLICTVRGLDGHIEAAGR